MLKHSAYMYVIHVFTYMLSIGLCLCVYVYMFYVYNMCIMCVHMFHTQASELCGTWYQRCRQLGARSRLDRPGAQHRAPVCARVCVSRCQRRPTTVTTKAKLGARMQRFSLDEHQAVAPGTRGKFESQVAGRFVAGCSHMTGSGLRLAQGVSLGNEGGAH